MNSLLRGLRVAAMLAVWLNPLAATSLPILSEVFYDATGSDDGLSFVELHGTPGASLDGLFVEGVNGSNGDVTHSIALSGAIGADGLFVLADDVGDGTSLVVGADQVADFDFQNGPDSVVLRNADAVLDAIGYGVFAPEDFFAGEGAPAPDAPADSSLARLFANVDTDDNAADFAVAIPTPGIAPHANVPEPTTGMLLAMGMIGLAAVGRPRNGPGRASRCGRVGPVASSPRL
jgi:hypothetical protein